MADCKTITFRPTPEFAQHIEALMKRWKCKRTQAILQAVEIAARGPEISADNDRDLGSARKARARLLGDNIRRTENLMQKVADRAPIAPAGRVDPEKMAAFQRKVGMDVFDAKRRDAKKQKAQ